MEPDGESQSGSGGLPAPVVGGRELITPNPKLKLLDQVREVMRLKHYSIRTERAYCDWIRRYIKFHGMRSREELLPAEEKMELFLSDLAGPGQVAVSTQNQVWFLVSPKQAAVRQGVGHFDIVKTSSWTLFLPPEEKAR